MRPNRMIVDIDWSSMTVIGVALLAVVLAATAYWYFEVRGKKAKNGENTAE